MKALLKEPLLHFLVLGAALFWGYALVSRPAATEPGKIVITQGQIEHLATGFARTWQRPPTKDELDGLLRDYVRSEIYAREAVALGLDRDDSVIRQRLRQKLEFVSEDLVGREEPSDDALRQWLAQHAEHYRTEAHFSFRQVYLNPERHGEHLADHATQILAKLQKEGAGADISNAGDPFLLNATFDGISADDVAKQFGDPFAGKLKDLKPGQWQGPVESGYGAHLVLVTEYKEGRMPALAEVRDTVRREWMDEQRREANDKLFRTLQQHYTIVIEEPKPEKAKHVAEAGR